MADQFNQAISRIAASNTTAAEFANMLSQQAQQHVRQQQQAAEAVHASGGSDALMRGSDKSSGLRQQQQKQLRPDHGEPLPEHVVRQLRADLEVASSHSHSLTGRIPPSGSNAPPVPTGERNTLDMPPQAGSTTERGATSKGRGSGEEGVGTQGIAAVGTERAGGNAQGPFADQLAVSGPGIRTQADTRSEPANGLTSDGNPAVAPHMSDVLPLTYGNRYRKIGSG